MIMRGFWTTFVIAAFVCSSAALAQTQADTPMKAARKRLTESQAELKKVKAEYDKAVAKLRTEFRKGDEWTKAQADQKQAQQELEACRKAILEALKNKPEYQKAVAEKTKADATRLQLREQNAPPDKMVEPLNKAMAANAAVTKLETDAIAADPKATDAKKRLAEATDTLDGLEKQFLESVKTNADLETARTALKTAEEQVAQATTNVKETAKQEAASRRNR